MIFNPYPTKMIKVTQQSTKTRNRRGDINSQDNDNDDAENDSQNDTDHDSQDDDDDSADSSDLETTDSGDFDTTDSSDQSDLDDDSLELLAVALNESRMDSQKMEQEVHVLVENIWILITCIVILNVGILWGWWYAKRSKKMKNVQRFGSQTYMRTDEEQECVIELSHESHDDDV
eukprot:1028508_1